MVYYKESDNCNPRWALPDVIATSKLDKYSWQDEFRLVFSITDALNFQKCTFQISPDAQRQPENSAEHVKRKFHVGKLHDLCQIHYF